MNGVALRAEQAVVDYLTAQTWPSDGSLLLESGSALLLEDLGAIILGYGLGAPQVLPSFSRGEYEDEDTQDTLPAYPRIIITAQSATPMQRMDSTCEVSIQTELQMSADDSRAIDIREMVGALDAYLFPLFDQTGASVLDAGTDSDWGPFVAQFAVPSEFGQSSTQNRARTYQRAFTLYCSATL
jgi:hypothetical protein